MIWLNGMIRCSKKSTQAFVKVFDQIHDVHRWSVILLSCVQCLHALLFVKVCRLPLANATKISPGIDGDGNGQFGGHRNPSQWRTRRWTVWSYSHPISANASLAAEANVKPHQQNRITSPITTNPSTRKCCLSLQHLQAETLQKTSVCCQKRNWSPLRRGGRLCHERNHHHADHPP